MYLNVNSYDFQMAFEKMNRANQFSYEALKALFNYIEDLETDTDDDFELDVIALCCDYSEIDEDEEAYKDYVGEDAPLQHLIIAELPTSILVCEG